MILGYIFALLQVIWASVGVQASETVEEAAKLARSLVDDPANAVGVIATIFPVDHSNLPGHPFALQEYYGSCFNNGSLALLLMSISQSTKNIFHDSNPDRLATITVHPDHPAAAKPRIALMGSVHTVPENLFESEGIEDCYLSVHPDAKDWVPSEWGYHASFWARFDPHSIFYVGGFGGLHYIGNIPVELYQSGGEPDSFRTVNQFPASRFDQMPMSF